MRGLFPLGANADAALAEFVSDRSPAVRAAVAETYDAIPAYCHETKRGLEAEVRTERNASVLRAIKQALEP